MFPESWRGCRTVETTGRRWLSEKTQRDASQITSLGASFENELVQDAKREEERLKDDNTRLIGEQAKANESFLVAAAATGQTVNGSDIFFPANAPVSTGSANLTLLEALTRVFETAKSVKDLEKKVAEARAAWQHAPLTSSENDAQASANTAKRHV